MIFPLEAFDEALSSSRINRISAFTEDNEHNIATFILREDLRILCNEMNIPDRFDVHYTKSHLRDILYEENEIRTKHSERLRNELKELMGLKPNDKLSFLQPNKISFSMLDIVKWFEERELPRIPNKQFLLLISEIEIPEEFLEFYLLVKLAI